MATDEPGTNGAKEPATHNYSRPVWGHACEVTAIRDGGAEVDGHGWGRGIEVGDFLILDDRQGATTRYRVDEIRYCHDPGDMWFATLAFAPRPGPPEPVRKGPYSTGIMYGDQSAPDGGGLKGGVLG